eukprot:m.420116 g.420116  ORF g.420116 m.420116 type:complete len:4951 (+) comp16844_c0_seq9:156-15008(+)
MALLGLGDSEDANGTDAAMAGDGPDKPPTEKNKETVPPPFESQPSKDHTANGDDRGGVAKSAADAATSGSASGTEAAGATAGHKPIETPKQGNSTIDTAAAAGPGKSKDARLGAEELDSRMLAQRLHLGNKVAQQRILKAESANPKLAREGSLLNDTETCDVEGCSRDKFYDWQKRQAHFKGKSHRTKVTAEFNKGIKKFGVALCPFCGAEFDKFDQFCEHLQDRSNKQLPRGQCRGGIAASQSAPMEVDPDPRRGAYLEKVFHLYAVPGQKYWNAESGRVFVFGDSVLGDWGKGPSIELAHVGNGYWRSDVFALPTRLEYKFVFVHNSPGMFTSVITYEKPAAGSYRNGNRVLTNTKQEFGIVADQGQFSQAEQVVTQAGQAFFNSLLREVNSTLPGQMLDDLVDAALDVFKQLTRRPLYLKDSYECNVSYNTLQSVLVHLFLQVIRQNPPPPRTTARVAFMTAILDDRVRQSHRSVPPELARVFWTAVAVLSMNGLPYWKDEPWPFVTHPYPEALLQSEVGEADISVISTLSQFNAVGALWPGHKSPILTRNCSQHQMKRKWLSIGTVQAEQEFLQFLADLGNFSRASQTVCYSCGTTANLSDLEIDDRYPTYYKCRSMAQRCKLQLRPPPPELINFAAEIAPSKSCLKQLFQRCYKEHPAQAIVIQRYQNEFIHQRCPASIWEAVQLTEDCDMYPDLLDTGFRELSAQLARPALHTTHHQYLKLFAEAIICQNQTDRKCQSTSTGVLFDTLSLVESWLADVLTETMLKAVFFSGQKEKRFEIYRKWMIRTAQDIGTMLPLFKAGARLVKLLGQARKDEDWRCICDTIREEYVRIEPRRLLQSVDMVYIDKQKGKLGMEKQLKDTLHELVIQAADKLIETADDVLSVIVDLGHGQTQENVRQDLPGSLATGFIQDVLQHASQPPISLRIENWEDALNNSELILQLKHWQIDCTFVTRANAELDKLLASLQTRDLPLRELITFVDMQPSIELLKKCCNSEWICEESLESCAEVIVCTSADVRIAEEFLFTFCSRVINANNKITDCDKVRTEWSQFKESYQDMPVKAFSKEADDTCRMMPCPFSDGVHGLLLRSPAVAVIRKHMRLAVSQTFFNTITVTKGERTDAGEQDQGSGEEDSDTEDGVTFAEFLGSLLPNLLDVYREIAQSLSLDTPVGEAEIIWVDVPSEDIDKECQLMIEFGANETGCCHEGVTNAALKSRIVAEQLKDQVAKLDTVADIFGYADFESPVCTAISVLKQIAKTCPLGELHEATVKVVESTRGFDKNSWDLVDALAGSKELVDFTIENLEEDTHALIDAVEEKYSDDQFAATPETVKDFIAFHSFLKPLLQHKADNVESFVKQLVQRHVDHLEKQRGRETRGGDDHERVENRKSTAELTLQCLRNIGSLKRLWKSLANRGQLTKEIIKDALAAGTFTVKCSIGSAPTLTLVCGGKGTFDHLGVRDLRSRALLLIASSQNLRRYPDDDLQGDTSQVDMRLFVDVVEAAEAAMDQVRRLCDAAHFGYRQFEWTWTDGAAAINPMREAAQAYEDDLVRWSASLAETREVYPVMQCFYGRQLVLLLDWIAAKETLSQTQIGECVALYRFASQKPPESLDEGQLDRLKALRAETFESGHLNKGSATLALAQLALSLSTMIPAGPSETLPQTNARRDLDVPPMPFSTRRAMIVTVPPDGSLIAAIGATLYNYNGASRLSSSQMLVCNANTVWPEIELLLMRSTQPQESRPIDDDAQDSSFGQEQTPPLHVLINPSGLSAELQYQLIQRINAMEDEAETRPMMLVVVARQHSHVVGQFRGERPAPQLKPEVERAIMERMSTAIRVVTVHSEQPGQGKTECIKTEAVEQQRCLKTLPLNGVVDRAWIIDRLSKLKLGGQDALHLDIGETSDITDLNLLLFEILVVGTLSAQGAMFHLPSIPAFIEIANTVNHRLQRGLDDISRLYSNTVELKWDLDRFYISDDGSSDTQICAKYLRAKKSGDLLTQDITCSSDDRLPPVRPEQARELLAEVFPALREEDCSFTTAATFIGVLAGQLRLLSTSVYFKTSLFRELQESPVVRQHVLDALVLFTQEFGAPTIGPCRQKQFHHMNPTIALLNRINGGTFKRWEDINQLMVLFNGDGSSVSILRREVATVPPEIQAYVDKQTYRGDTGMRILDTLNGKELIHVVANVAGRNVVDYNESSYVLCPDNALKMCSIYLRVSAGIPCVLMGHAGCGKTSLVRYLAKTICKAAFVKLDVHAGITANQIEAKVLEAEEIAEKEQQPVWIFLDEINTCHHLGLVAEIMCQRTIHGRPIHPGCVLLAACNPYERRPANELQTVGLDARTSSATGKHTADELAGLTYRVHPLPENLLLYVWDYGSLDEDTETTYIRSMVARPIPQVSYRKSDEKQPYSIPINEREKVAALLCLSQKFTRGPEDAQQGHTVSLRDVTRCVSLIPFFLSLFAHREKSKEYRAHVRGEPYTLPDFDRALLLALAVTYHSRVSSDEKRAEYRRSIAERLSVDFGHYLDCPGYLAVLESEQRDILQRMNFRLWPNIAHNGALLENTFIMFVCILNRIPVFVVGKPGNSKSLAIQLINSSMRGADSLDPLFQRLPGVNVVSYQGSPSSTSEGIQQVFDKAARFCDDDIVPVVLLDEIGLAEISKHNPLKVLHALLEPDGTMPDVAVVGISNWALDTAKMNRAVHLSRPDPTEEDLVNTGNTIIKSFGDVAYRMMHRVDSIARAYHKYYRDQVSTNFHGLRDFYSLVKHIGRRCSDDDRLAFDDALYEGLCRNFGGLPSEMPKICEAFKVTREFSRSPVSPVDEIKRNLSDRHARHLLLVTDGDAALTVLKDHLKAENIALTEIYGSRFPADESADYAYRILSQIILCMEAGGCLVLRSLDAVYGALYDMLNQHYTVVGGRRNCRIALGAESNPMCFVHDSFRCIVIVDQVELLQQDPPFINRFEKQVLCFVDALTEQTLEAQRKLRRWAQRCCPSEQDGAPSSWPERDTFLGCSDVTLGFAVRGCEDEPNESKRILLRTVSTDGMIRFAQAQVSTEPDEWAWCQQVHEKEQHLCLGDCLAATIAQQEDHHGPVMLAVMTFSGIHVSLPAAISEAHVDTIRFQSYRVAELESEQQLLDRIDGFLDSPSAPDGCSDVLILQMRQFRDAPLAQLVRARLEERFGALGAELRDAGLRKHVCAVIHMERERREGDDIGCESQFMSGWERRAIDSIVQNPLPLLHRRSFPDVLSDLEIFRTVCAEEMFWCFTRINYPSANTADSTRTLDYIAKAITAIMQSDQLMAELFKLVKGVLVQTAPTPLKDAQESGTHGDGGILENGSTVVAEDEDTEGAPAPPKHETDALCVPPWVLDVATDRTALSEWQTLHRALHAKVREAMRTPLCRIIHQLEKSSALPTFVRLATNEDALAQGDLVDGWIQRFTQVPANEWFEVTRERQLMVESLPLPADYNRMMRIPFGSRVIEKLEAQKVSFQQAIERLQTENTEDSDEAMLVAEFDQFRDRMVRLVPEAAEPWLQAQRELYIHDLMMLLGLGMELPPDDRAVSLAGFIDGIAARLRWFSRSDTHTIVDVHLILWYAEDEIRAQLDLLAIVGQLSPESLRKCVQGIAEHGQTAALIKRACSLKLRQLIPQHETEMETVTSASELTSWLPGATRVYIQASALLNASQSADDVDAAQPSVDAIKIMSDFIELAVLPGTIPSERIPDLAREMYRVVKQRDAPDEFLGEERVREAIWAASNPVTDEDGDGDGDPALPTNVAHFRTTVIKRICTRPDLLADVEEADGWVSSRLFTPNPPPGTAVVIAALLEDESILGEEDEDGELDENADVGSLTSLIADGDVTTQTLGVIADGLGALRNNPLCDGDPAVAALLCDQLEHRIAAENLEYSELAVLVRQAQLGMKDEGSALRVIASVALIKVALSVTLEFFDGADATTDADDEDADAQELTRAVRELLADDHPLALACAVYMIKLLRHDEGSPSIEDVAARCRVAPFPKLVDLSERLCFENTDWLPCNPLAPDTLCIELSNAVAVDGTDGGTARVDEFATQVAASTPHRLAVIATLLHRYALPTATRPLLPEETRDRDTLRKVVADGQCSDVARELIAGLPDNMRDHVTSLTSDNELSPAAGMRASVQACLIARLVAESDRESLLHRCLLNPTELGADFFVSAPDNDTLTLQQALGGITLYSCVCGAKFFIGECGQPMETGTCLSCKAQVGGTGHTALPGSTVQQAEAEPPRGYPAPFVESAGAFTAPERGALPTTTRILDVFVHMCLLAGARYCDKEADVQTFMGLQSAERVGEVCARRIETAWTGLQQLAGGSDEDVFILLHDCLSRLPEFLDQAPPRLSTPELRKEWEQVFQRVVAAPGPSQSVDAPARVGAFRRRVAEAEADRITPLHARVDEVGQTENPEVIRPRLFRYHPQKTRALIEGRLEDSQASATDHAFLQYVLESEEDLELTVHLVPLVRWSTVVVQRCSHRIDRDKARATKIGHFLREQPDSDELDELFTNFAEAWKAVVASGRVTHLMELENSVATPTCTEIALAQYSELTKESALSLCCIEPKSDGGLLWSMILKLGQMQNDAMRKVAELTAAGVRALRNFRSVDGDDVSARVPMRSLCNVQLADIATFEWDDDALDFVHFCPEVGHGREAVVDLVGVEEQMAFSTVHGRRALALENLDVVTYKKELFVDAGSLFDDLQKQVEQRPLPPDSQIFSSSEIKEHASALLDVLSVIIWSVARVGGKPSTTIQAHIEHRLQGQLSPSALAALRDTQVAGRQLCHLQALYEGVEDLLTDVRVEELPAEFCEPQLPPGVDAMLEERIGGEEGQIPLAALVGCLRRFVFRYLRVFSPTSGPQPNHQLVFHLDDPRRWPGGAVPRDFDEKLPQDLELKHTYVLLTRLQERLAKEMTLQNATAHGGEAAAVPQRKLQRRPRSETVKPKKKTGKKLR